MKTHAMFSLTLISSAVSAQKPVPVWTALLVMPAATAHTPRPAPTWHLVLDHEIAPADGGPGELAHPQGIALLPDGRVFIADIRPGVVMQFDAKGVYRGLVGREGDGPGEYRSPNIAVGHNWLMIQDQPLARLTLYTVSGKLIRSFRTAAVYAIPFADSHGIISLDQQTNLHGATVHRLLRFDSLGKFLDTLPVPRAMPPAEWISSSAGPCQGCYAYTGMSVPFAPRNQNVRTPDGGFIFGRTDVNLFMVSRTGRDTLRSFGRKDLAATQIRPALRDSMYHLATDGNERMRGVASLADIPKSYALWYRVDRDGDGNVWITRGGQPGEPSVLDVYGPDGAFQMTVPSPWPAATSLVAWAGDRVATVEMGKDDKPVVRVWRVVRG